MPWLNAMRIQLQRTSCAAMLRLPASFDDLGKMYQCHRCCRADFTKWWRSELDRQKKRPGKAAILAWYNKNAESAWPEDVRPTFQVRSFAGL